MMKMSKQVKVKGSGAGGKSLYVRISDLAQVLGVVEGDIVTVTIEVDDPFVETEEVTE